MKAEITGLPVELTAVLAQLCEAVLVTTSLLTPPGPVIVYANAAFTHLTGYHPNDVLGQTPRILQGPLTDRATLAELRAQLTAGQPFFGQTVNYKKDGTPFDIEWSVSPLRLLAGDVTHFLAIQRDVSRHESHRRSDVESRNLVRQAQRFGRIGFWSTSTIQPEADLVFSQGLLDLLGLPAGLKSGALIEALGQMLRPNDLEQLQRQFSQVIRTKTALEFTVECLTRSHERKWIYVRGEVEAEVHAQAPRVIGIAKDVTAQNAALFDLMEAEERFRAAVDANKDGLFICQALRDPEGAIVDFSFVYVSSAAAATEGLDPEDFAKGTMLSLLPFTAEGLLEKLIAVVYTEEPLVDEMRTVTSGETERWLRYSAVRVRDGVALTVRDETESRTLERMLRQSQKLESLGRLAGGIAHDFNNYLSAIIGFGAFVKESLAPNDPMHEDMGEILKNARRASNLTRQLLAFSRQQVLAPVVIDLFECALNLRGVLRPLLGDGIEVQMNADPDLAKVKTDPSQIEQVILNLAVNARDAMGAQGVLKIQFHNVHISEDEARRNAELRAGAFVKLVVSDTGHGMTPEILEKIFEPFFTTKPLGKGTGLGLPTVYGIVNQSGGFIRVESTPGKGTNFEVHLPSCKDATTSTLPPKETVSTRVLEGTELVLVTEDDASVRRFIGRLLKRHGYHVVEAQDGAEALALAQRIPTIRLLLSDMVMPHINGIDLAAELKAIIPGIAVVFVSGYTEGIGLSQDWIDQGVVLLPKPLDSQQLLTAVRNALDQSNTRLAT
jgi:two-component system, cell cycle sensor histidine kinase and response regulator CckA